MKIAYVTTYDPNDIHQWSGTGYTILNTLKQEGFEVETLGNLHDANSYFLQRKRRLYRKYSNKKYLKERDPRVLMSYARQVKENLLKINSDVIFSPGTIPIALLKTDKPIVFWTDATFAGMINFYPAFSNICKESIRSGNRQEQAALSNCSLAIYASDWAAKTALENYRVDPRKVHVIPFGANLSSDMDESGIKNILHNKPYSPVKLLFVGVDWKRKGGDLALKVAESLNAKGVMTELHIVGCNPNIDLPDFVILHGFISKQTEDGISKLKRLFLQSHFFILPSMAEAFGIVFAEASSFGVPSLATNVGGIPSAVRDGINGKLFPLSSVAEEYCDFIMPMIASKEKYESLALSAYQEYKERLNWNTSGKVLGDLIRESCAWKS